MNKVSWLIPLMILALSASSSYAQNCSTHVFSNGARFATCNSLPVLNSSLHWTYHPNNRTADIAYRHGSVSASNWVAWGINLAGSRMVGTQCLVAIPSSGGGVRAYTSPITSLGTQLQQGNLSFRVQDLSAVLSRGEITIFATIFLPQRNSTSFDTLWQDGPLSGNTPQIHSMNDENKQSHLKVDFATGQTTSGGGGGTTSITRRRNVHGVLNAVSWGVLMPIGAIIARYLKVFKSADPAWFFLHVGCQTTAYAVGVAGWITGMKLGSDSKGITYTTHRRIGITLFTLGTLQVLALLMRPKKDHKYRIYWNFYHWGVGYTVIVLSIVNVYKGFEALDGQKNWKRAYTGVIIFLGAIAVLLEAITWGIVLKRKKSAKNHPVAVNGHHNAV